VEPTVVSPFPPEAWPSAWAWIQTFQDRVCDDYAPKTCADFVAQQIARAGLVRTWGVWADGQLGGALEVQALSPVTAVAHLLFRRSFWGRCTRPAAAAVFGEVFAGGVEKISLFPFTDNHQVRQFLRALGAVEEGVLRAQTRRGGKPLDVVAMALFKEAFLCRGQH